MTPAIRSLYDRANAFDRWRAIPVLSEFLERLFAGREIGLDVVRRLDDQELASARVRLAEYEALHRLEVPGVAPEFDVQIALEAAVQFLSACSFVVHRDAPIDVVSDAMGEPVTDQTTPTAHYSVDLTFRFLPDLAKLAASIAEEDPLVEGLQHWGIRWPLSSIGMNFEKNREIDANALEPIVADASLFRLYADRVIERKDMSRLSHPVVANTVRAAVRCGSDLPHEFLSALDRPRESYDPAQSPRNSITRDQASR